MSLYRRLGLDRTATQEEIKQRYRLLMRTIYHPERANEEAVKKINDAYATLSDPVARREYNHTGLSKADAGSPPYSPEEFRGTAGRKKGGGAKGPPRPPENFDGPAWAGELWPEETSHRWIYMRINELKKSGAQMTPFRVRAAAALIELKLPCTVELIDAIGTLPSRERWATVRRLLMQNRELASLPRLVQLIGEAEDSARFKVLSTVAVEYGIIHPKKELLALLERSTDPAYSEMLMALIERVGLGTLVRNPVWVRATAAVSIPHGAKAAEIAVRQGAGISPKLFVAAAGLGNEHQVKSLSYLVKLEAPLEYYLQGEGLQRLEAVESSESTRSFVEAAHEELHQARINRCGIPDRLRALIEEARRGKP